MPMPTLLAFADHGEVTGATGDVDADEVEQELAGAGRRRAST